MEKYVERLVNEWAAHEKIIVAVDFDDTIFPWSFTSQEECDDLIEFLIWIRTIGAYIVIFTASDHTRYNEIREYCASKSLNIDSINKNPIDLPYGKDGKIYYNIFLCDRAGLNESKQILDESAKRYITHTKSQEQLNDIA